jgi:hypothetical protein
MGEEAEFLNELINMPIERPSEISQAIEGFCTRVIASLKDQNLTDSNSDFLENHAYSINSRIKDASLRNLAIML